MHVQKLYTNPDVTDKDDEDPEFYSFILENDDIPISRNELDEA